MSFSICCTCIVHSRIAQKIISGERLKPDDDLKFFLTTPLEELQAGARLIQKNFLVAAALGVKLQKILGAR